MRGPVRLLGAMTVALLAAGCTGPGQPTAAVPPPAPTSAGASPFCDRASFDLSSMTADIHAVRGRFPSVTDNLAAYAVSLLPNRLWDTAAVTLTIGSANAASIVTVEGDHIVLKPDADIAPAEFAGNLVVALTLSIADRDGHDATTAVRTAYTLSTDTYIKLVTTTPQLARGPHSRNRPGVPEAVTRLRGIRQVVTVDAIPTAPFADAPGYLDAFAAFFGVEYYHPDPNGDTWTAHTPLPAADATALAEQLTCS